MTGLHYEPSVLVTCYEAPSKGPVAALLGKPGRGELLSAPRPYLFIDKAPASSNQSIPLPRHPRPLALFSPPATTAFGSTSCLTSSLVHLASSPRAQFWSNPRANRRILTVFTGAIRRSKAIVTRYVTDYSTTGTDLHARRQKTVHSSTVFCHLDERIIFPDSPRQGLSNEPLTRENVPILGEIGKILSK